MGRKLARVKDLEVRLGVPIGSLKGTDLQRAKAALKDASGLIRAELCESDFGDRERIFIKTLCIQVALRLYRYIYIEGAERQEIAHSMGDYSAKYTDASKITATLTDDELELLRNFLGYNAPHTITSTSAYFRMPCTERSNDPDYKDLLKRIKALEGIVEDIEGEVEHIAEQLIILKTSLPKQIEDILVKALKNYKIKPENILPGKLSKDVQIQLSDRIKLDSFHGIVEEVYLNGLVKNTLS